MNRIKRILIFIYYRYIIRDSINYHRLTGVKVGENCRIFPFTFSSEPFLIEIGNWVTITAGVRLLTHDGSTWLFRDEKGRRHKYQRITIGNNVFIGIDSIIMPGVCIKDNVIVAAGSVVTNSISEGKIVAGNPAKVIGSFDEFKNSILISNISDDDIDYNLPFRERILEVVDRSNKKEI